MINKQNNMFQRKKTSCKDIANKFKRVCPHHSSLKKKNSIKLSIRKLFKFFGFDRNIKIVSNLLEYAVK